MIGGNGLKLCEFSWARLQLTTAMDTGSSKVYKTSPEAYIFPTGQWSNHNTHLDWWLSQNTGAFNITFTFYPPLMLPVNSLWKIIRKCIRGSTNLSVYINRAKRKVQMHCCKTECRNTLNQCKKDWAQTWYTLAPRWPSQSNSFYTWYIKA